MSVSHRTQITLTDELYATLKRTAEQTGVTMSELVRRALQQTLGDADSDFSNALEESAGAWKDRDFDGKEYVERLRSPGLGHRLARWQ